MLSAQNVVKKMRRCNCCECSEHPINGWSKPTDVPQYGSTFLQMQVCELIPALKDDRRLLSAYALVKFIGQPSNCHGMGVYKVTKCLGFEHMEGRMFGIGYDKVYEIKNEPNT